MKSFWLFWMTGIVGAVVLIGSIAAIIYVSSTIPDAGTAESEPHGSASSTKESIEEDIEDEHAQSSAPSVNTTPEPVACQADAMLCPDGSAVGRVPPSCEFAACPKAATVPGVLTGAVAIGPVCPVEREDEPCEPSPTMYAERKIHIYNQERAQLIKEVSISENGTYTTELPEGRYVVDINHLGIDASSDVPTEVAIVSGATTTLDIDIDTGIR